MVVADEPNIDVACPLLGLVNDRQTHFTYPHPRHRCHVRAAPATIEPAHQGAYCLNLRFPDCDRYQAWQSENAAGRALLEAKLSQRAESGAPTKAGRARQSGARPKPRGQAHRKAGVQVAEAAAEPTIDAPAQPAAGVPAEPEPATPAGAKPGRRSSAPARPKPRDQAHRKAGVQVAEAAAEPTTDAPAQPAAGVPAEPEPATPAGAKPGRGNSTPARPRKRGETPGPSIEAD
jgi:hypothetical protein